MVSSIQRVIWFNISGTVIILKHTDTQTWNVSIYYIQSKEIQKNID